MRWRRQSPTDFSNEIRAHIALETDRLIAERMRPDDAAPEARRRFGNVTSATERHHESRRTVARSAATGPSDRGPAICAATPWRRSWPCARSAPASAPPRRSLTIRDVIFENPPPLYADAERLSKVQVDRQDRLIFRGSNVPGDLYTSWRENGGLTIAASIPPRGEHGRPDVRPRRARTGARGHGELFSTARRQPGGRGFSPVQTGAGEPPRPSSAIATGSSGSANVRTRSAARSGSTTLRTPSSA